MNLGIIDKMSDLFMIENATYLKINTPYLHLVAACLYCMAPDLRPSERMSDEKESGPSSNQVLALNEFS
jgi:hypothetical protein